MIEKAGLSQNAQEIVFEGADFGKKPGIHENIPFERSLPLEKALHPDTIIAFQYNDRPLSYKHGYLNQDNAWSSWSYMWKVAEKGE